MSALFRALIGFAWRWLDKLDGPLMLGLLAIMGISLVVQASAGGDAAAVWKQGVRFAVGLGALVALSRVSPNTPSAVDAAGLRGEPCAAGARVYLRHWS